MPKVGVGLAPFSQEGSKYFSASSKATSGAKDTLTRVGVDELPNASPQDGANKDVENDHLSGMRPSRGDAAP